MNSIGVFAIILDSKKRVLLCHRCDYNLWNLPGGKLEKGEAPWGGVIREVKEETGLNVAVDKLIGTYFKPKNNHIVFQFLCKTKNGKLRLNDEANKLEYFSLDKLPKNTVIKQKERIKDYFNNYKNKPILKIQKGKSTLEILKNKKL